MKEQNDKLWKERNNNLWKEQNDKTQSFEIIAFRTVKLMWNHGLEILATLVYLKYIMVNS